MFWGSRILEPNETETESAKKGLNGLLHVASGENRQGIGLKRGPCLPHHRGNTSRSAESCLIRRTPSCRDPIGKIRSRRRRREDFSA